MAHGLVVITTPHTAGPDLIAEGVEGFIVPIRSAEAIEEKLVLLARERERLCAMQRAAWRKAESLGWESYRAAVVKMAQEVIGKSAQG
jgi:glycosyltransferase involved in cell wall biosynthesis